METPHAPARERIVRFDEFKARVGYGKSRIYDLIKLGKFPAPIRLPGGRAVGWPESTVNDLIDRIVAGKVV